MQLPGIGGNTIAVSENPVNRFYVVHFAKIIRNIFKVQTALKQKTLQQGQGFHSFIVMLFTNRASNFVHCTSETYHA